MPVMHRCATSLLMIASLCAIFLPATALAQETAPREDADTQAAAEDYARAIKLYNEGKNREALQAFNAAISKSSEPVYLCNRAVVLMTLEEYALAISDLKTCRDTYDMSDLERAYIDAQLKALSTFEYVLQPKSRAIAERIANPPQARDTSSDTPDPDPSRGNLQPPPEATSPLRATGWVALGTGAGALIGVAALELITRQEVRTFRQQCLDLPPPHGGTDCARLQSTLVTQQKLSRVLLVSGGALSILGGSLLWLSRPAPEPHARRWKLSPELSRHGAALRYQLDF